MTLIGVRCTELDRGVQANTIFQNIHCVGHWIQRNILCIDHTTSFYKPTLQIIHSLMKRQHNVCLNTKLLQQLIANFQRTRGVKYSLPVLVTRLCRNFLPNAEFFEYDRVLATPERITSAYNNHRHSIRTPTVQLGDVPAMSSSEEQMNVEDEPQFWRQPPPTKTNAFMSSIWKGMKKIFRGQIRLRRQLEDQSTRLERIEDTLRRSRSVGPSTSSDPSRRRQ